MRVRVPGGGGTYRCAVLIDSSCDGPIGNRETASGNSVCGGDWGAPADPRLVANAEGGLSLAIGQEDGQKRWVTRAAPRIL